LIYCVARIQEVICWQEGTLKKINKDRNEKTTRNIQEGLPFTITEVKRQTEDPKLVAAVSTMKHVVANNTSY